MLLYNNKKKSINKVKIDYNIQTRNIKVAFPFFGVKNVYTMCL